MQLRVLIVVAVLAGSIAAVIAAPDPGPSPKAGKATPPKDKLAVTAIDPSAGDSEGGTYARIIGSRFIADGARNAKVYFGSHEGTVIRFASDSELIVEAPAGKVDEKVDVRVVFDPGGEQKLVGAFTFVKRQ